MDQDLPPEERSAHGRRLDQLREMTEVVTNRQGQEEGGALSTATGVSPKRAAVTAAIDQLRGLFGAVAPTIPDNWQPVHAHGAVLDFLLNEKYTSDQSAGVMRRSENNRHLAHLYSGAVFEMFASHVRRLGFATTLSAKLGPPTGDLFEAARKKLEDVMVALYDALDDQRKAIEDFKRNPPSASRAGGGLLEGGSMGVSSPPLDIGGQPVKPAKP